MEWFHWVIGAGLCLLGILAIMGLVGWSIKHAFT